MKKFIDYLQKDSSLENFPYFFEWYEFVNRVPSLRFQKFQSISDAKRFYKQNTELIFNIRNYV
ncbi:MAG: hypothetical protein Unbinned6486contig1001_27 [Prokaryotic dsDNA virus sp.]|nr:MAG: hypothetical protein Unbinned6486contig1001_27 [Prokaryotic dsDNA virus sp.]|tara:strand:+ start:6664 stop:6852 length:189 start_codon:yes stop_codon:yes gene_type:complete